MSYNPSLNVHDVVTKEHSAVAIARALWQYSERIRLGEQHLVNTVPCNLSERKK